MEHRGAGLPVGMGEVLLVFLAKGGRPSDLPSAPPRSPGARRPPAVAGADCKITSLAFLLEVRTSGP
eukprot:9141173-Pyramimonas_sp.AAC.1